MNARPDRHPRLALPRETIDRHGESTENPDKLKARFTRFVQVVIENAKTDYMRRRARTKEVPFAQIEDILGQMPSRQSTDEFWLDASSDNLPLLFENERLAQAFKALGERDQRLIVLLYVHDLPMQSAVKKLGITEAAGYKAKSRLLEKLRAAMSE